MKPTSIGKQMVDETLASGVLPIVFDYQDVVFFEKESHLVRTCMVFNSLDLGTLTFKEYRFVARRTAQGANIVKRHAEKLLRLIPQFLKKFPQTECFTFPVFPRLLRDGELASILFDVFTLCPKIHPSMLCAELSADILYEDTDVVRARIEEIRQMGVKVAITEVGDEFCPAFKLTDLTFDYLILDNFVTQNLNRDDAERVAGGLIKYLASFGVPVIAPELDDEIKIKNAKMLGCDGYSVAAEPMPYDIEEEIALEDEEEDLEDFDEIEEVIEEIEAIEEIEEQPADEEADLANDTTEEEVAEA